MADTGEGFDPTTMDPAIASQMFQDPAFLRAVASSALKHGLPAGLQWLERSAAAAKENAFQASALLEAGDAEGAIKAFNASGQFTDASGAVKNDDGTWTLHRASGQSVTVDPVALRRSFLLPKDYFEQRYREEQAKTHAKQVENEGEYQRRIAATHEQQAATDEEYKRGLISNRDEANRIREESSQALAAARAENARVAQEAALHKAALTSKYSYAGMYNERLKELAQSDVPVADRPAMAHMLTRSSFTHVAPQADGSFAVVDSSSGEPRVLATYPSFDAANSAGQAWVSGKGLPKAETSAGGAAPAETKGVFRRVVDAVTGGSSSATPSAGGMVWGVSPRSGAEDRPTFSTDRSTSIAAVDSRIGALAKRGAGITPKEQEELQQLVAARAKLAQ